MQITKEFLLKNIILTANKAYYEINLFSELFQKKVRIWVYSSSGDKENDISEATIQSINSFLRLEPTLFTRIKAEVWKHYNILVQGTSYGMMTKELLEKHRHNEEAANRELFGCLDELDTIREAKIDSIYVDDNRDESEQSFSIYFEVAWEKEHGINLFFRNGALMSVE
jgi:hypothetical protein